jgi:Cu(I)/Ag(I) efflux system membrane fusion protein
MKQSTGVGFGVVAVAIIAAGGGYWLGHRGSAPTAPGASAAMTGASAPTDDTGKQERRLLFYRNPMGLPDTSPVPKKDPMGMDYIPVYEGEESAEAGSGIVVSTEKVQKLGVRTEIAALRELSRSVRASGRIEVDERRLHTVSPKFEGWIEKLHVNATGQPVGRGQPLAEVYSPELVSAQKEYAIAAQGRESLRDAGPEAQAGMKQLADSGLSRLRNWDISDEQIARLREGGEVRRTLTLRSPASGIVMEKKAVAGMRFMPGEMLYQVADLSSVWVIADVFEQDIGLVRVGQQAKVRIGAYPDKAFEGTVTYVYPTLKAETRSVPVRVELANPGGLLKPAMFASLELSAAGGAKVLAVPSSAVIDSGVRRVVLVQSGGDAKAGRFEPREVKLGVRSGDYVEVLEGVKEGEPVVVAANFLIDAESNLKAALGRRLRQSQSRGHGETRLGLAQGGGHAEGHRRRRRHGERQPRSGRQPRLAGDDHGLRAGQSLPDSRELQAGQSDRLRVRRAQAGRMGDLQARSEGRGAAVRPRGALRC